MLALPREVVVSRGAEIFARRSFKWGEVAKSMAAQTATGSFMCQTSGLQRSAENEGVGDEPG